MDKKLNSKALEESYLSKSPVISLNEDLNPFYNKSSYKIPGNFVNSKNKINSDLFNSILITTLRKAAKVKRVFPLLFPKLKTISLIKKTKKNILILSKNLFKNAF